MKVSIVGIPWYRESDYPEILRIMADAKLLPTTFRDWQKNAQGVEKQVTGKGLACVRAIFDPKTFGGWCAGRGLKLDANSRIAFANEVAYQHGVKNGS